ncbi:MAG TPA: dockerin type I repeat-containing protein [Bacteroidales bacterium]|nr:dockerin type I repeat-containing protein [Bacteroidales bacterium]
MTMNIKSFHLLFSVPAIIFLLPFSLKAQLPPGWEYTPSYSSHVIVIHLSANPTLNGEPLSAGDHIGVFYDDAGILKCAGAVIWNGTSNVSVSAWGDDTYEAGKQGFYEDDLIHWKLYHWATSQDADAEATWQIGCTGCNFWDGNWHDFGLSALASLGATTTVPGDANCDGIVNVLDIITIVNYIMGLNPSPFCFANADTNGDTAISVLDLIITVNIIMGG